MTAKRKIVCGAVVLTGFLSIGLFVQAFIVGHRANEAEMKFFKCKGSMSFVRIALLQYAEAYHALPYNADLQGEELFHHLDFGGTSHSCPSGAPGMEHGGYQMINASPSTWSALTESLGRVPILWCGAEHKVGPRLRLCLTIGPNLDVDSVRYDVVNEESVHAQVAAINDILISSGKRPVACNVPGMQE